MFIYYIRKNELIKFVKTVKMYLSLVCGSFFVKVVSNNKNENENIFLFYFKIGLHSYNHSLMLAEEPCLSNEMTKC